MQNRRTTLHDIVAGAIVAAALALPFIPLPDGGAARMKVQFRTVDSGKPQSFSTDTSQSVCTIMAAALNYENPQDGAFTHVKCGE
jgi:hypothetical protein